MEVRHLQPEELFAGGSTPGNTNVIQYIQIMRTKVMHKILEI